MVSGIFRVRSLAEHGPLAGIKSKKNPRIVQQLLWTHSGGRDESRVEFQADTLAEYSTLAEVLWDTQSLGHLWLNLQGGTLAEYGTLAASMRKSVPGIPLGTGIALGCKTQAVPWQSIVVWQGNRELQIPGSSLEAEMMLGWDFRGWPGRVQIHGSDAVPAEMVRAALETQFHILDEIRSYGTLVYDA